jgi:phage terminase large subunit-like protein
VRLTHASMLDNPHLPEVFIERMRKRYEGTRLGRQELLGELIDDVQGALWTRALLDAHRVYEHPDLVRVVVAIDPAATSTDGSNDTGIIVAGVGVDGHGYVLKDLTCHLSPDGWGKRAVAAYREHTADRIVAEVNNGGEMVAHVIKTVDLSAPFKAVHASRGKQTRAEPISALYEQGRVHHVGGLPELEDEQCTWVPGEADSPDRMDALVWALTDLMLGLGPASAPSFGTKKSRFKLG